MGDNNPAEVTPVPSAVCTADFTFKSNIFQLLPHTQGNVVVGYMKETRILLSSLSGSECKTPYLHVDAMSYSCPRDGFALLSPDDSGRSTFSRRGIHHCDECSGMLLEAC